MWQSNAVRRLHHRLRRAAALGALAILLVLAATDAASAFPSSVQLKATLQPAQISLDQAAQLDITLQGTQAGEPRLPQVDGLTITPIGQSSSSESINGVTSASVSLTYRVSAARPGRYIIPAIHFQGASTAALSLQVLPPRAGGAGASSAPPLPPPALGTRTSMATGHSGADRTAFVQLILPKRRLYVGELLPVEIKAYFRSDLGVNLDGPPTLQSDAFTISNLTSNPQQSQTQIGGIPYTTLSWYAALVPIKNGSYAPALELPVTLQIHEASSDALPLPDLDKFFDQGGFDSSFFDDSTLQSLLGREIDQSKTLKTPAIGITVLPLPTAGQPPGFSGAVGSFQIDSHASPSDVAQGDPLTMTLNVHGVGNFDRVTSAGIPSSAIWKSYRPQASFVPQDSVGREGTKRFEQTVVPKRSGVLQLPALEFSYFDPNSGHYVVRRTVPQALTVTPGAGPVSTPAATVQPPPDAAFVGTLPATQLAPLMAHMGPRTASLRPVVQRSWFPLLPAVPLAVMAAGLVLLARRERRRASDPASAAAASAAAISALLATADAAIQSGDSATFFRTAQRALQIRLGRTWSLAPDAVTLAELDARLDASWGPVREIFVLAELSAYAGGRPPSASLPHWGQVLHEQLSRAQQL